MKKPYIVPESHWVSFELIQNLTDSTDPEVSVDGSELGNGGGPGDIDIGEDL